MSGRHSAGLKRRSATSITILGLASSAIIIIANLASGIITARALGPEGRAVVLTATVWTLVNTWVFLFGLRQSTQYQIAPLSSRSLSNALAGSALVMATGFGLLAAGLSQVVVGMVISDPVLQGPTRLMLLGTVIIIWYEVVCGVVSGRHRVGVTIALRTSQALLYVGAVGVALVVDRLTGGVALVGLLASFGIPALIGFVVVLRTGGVGAPKFGHMKTLLRYGLRTYPGSLASLTNARIDLLVIPAVLTTASVGYYGVASNTSNVMQQLLGNLALYLFPAMVASDVARRKELMQRTLRLTIGLGIAGAVVGSIVAGPVIRLLYGSAFDETVPLLRILLFAAVSYAVLGVLSSGLTAHALPLRASMANLVGVPATVLGLVLLVPRLGAEGAAITSLVAYTLCAGLALFLCPPDLLRRRTLLSTASWRQDLHTLAAKVRPKVSA